MNGSSYIQRGGGAGAFRLGSPPGGLEELVLAYLREPGAAALPGPLTRATQNSGVRA